MPARYSWGGRNGHTSLFIQGDEVIFASQFTIRGKIPKTPTLSEHMAYVTTREKKLSLLGTFKSWQRAARKRPWSGRRPSLKSIFAEPVISGNSLVVASFLAGIYALIPGTTRQTKTRAALLPAAQWGCLFTSGFGGQPLHGSEEKVTTAFQFGGGEISKRWRFPVNQAIHPALVYLKKRLSAWGR